MFKHFVQVMFLYVLLITQLKFLQPLPHSGLEKDSSKLV